ncbi:lysophospholipid acyltransferase family protein [Jannaschia aquimarina]|uniref:2-acyl-glycerophospho-ethanolamine acyltransferase n=1 Tax=Jannaschia aquimarina TaxID=935700 RepID=A0A0D1EG35_9RHOB|nr:lysophospholipid acyltransferase family protein [Jannaschia aquimarina]KIT16634.1 2-acyl-glycerophospho-ethanolamine acyltransferase [Jannaschia aquimarina]SNS93755.1 1-acyl-sn-glycerol-3-phosphate acyltransferase [Jannaschia aquimarina]
MRAAVKRLAARFFEGAIVTFARFVCAPRVMLDEPLDAGPSRVFIANHGSNADTILIWAALPPEMRRSLRPVAAADYWLTSRFRAFIGRDVFRILPVERDPEARTGDPIADMASALEAGHSLILFPEGRRNPGPERLLPFKTGIYHLSQARPGTEFVPIWIDNLNGVLPRGELVPVPLICTLRFGAALVLERDEDKAAFLARAEAAVLALAPDAPAEDTPQEVAHGA